MNRFGESRTEPAGYRPRAGVRTDYAICMLDVAGKIMSWSHSAPRFNETDASEVLGKHYWIFFTSADQCEGMPGHALAIARSEGRFESEGWWRCIDGSRFQAHVVVAPIHERSGVLAGFVAITRDMTGQRAAQPGSCQAGGQSRLSVQYVTDQMIYLLDEAGHISNWNIDAQRIAGYRSHEVIGRHVSLLYTKEDRKKGEPRRSLDIAASDGRHIMKGWRVLKDGTVVLASVVIGALRDHNATLIGFAEVAHDMRITRDQPAATPSASGTRRGRPLHAQQTGRAGHAADDIGPDVSEILAAVFAHHEFVQQFLPEGSGGNPLPKNATSDKQSAYQPNAGSRHRRYSVVNLSFATATDIAEEPTAVMETASAQTPAHETPGRDTPGHDTTSPRQFVVLAVDDDRLVLMDTMTMLNGMGHRVFTATSARQALSLIQRETMIDLVIIDHVTAEMTGLELAETIRLERPSLPIFFTPPVPDVAQKRARLSRCNDVIAAITRSETSRHFGLFT